LHLDEIGEKSLDYSLPPKKIEAFLSPEARGRDVYRELSESWISQLAVKSKMRVAADPEFQKISEELKKAQAQGKLIKVGDAVKDKEKKEKAKALRTAKKEDREKEYLKRPEIRESIQVLMDLIELGEKDSKIASRSY
ncbi:MAG: carboxy terminal-processing peptidase, partial [Bdellovibrio sp.]